MNSHPRCFDFMLLGLSAKCLHSSDINLQIFFYMLLWCLASWNEKITTSFSIVMWSLMLESELWIKEFFKIVQFRKILPLQNLYFLKTIQMEFSYVSEWRKLILKNPIDFSTRCNHFNYSTILLFSAHALWVNETSHLSEGIHTIRMISRQSQCSI